MRTAPLSRLATLLLGLLYLLAWGEPASLHPCPMHDGAAAYAVAAAGEHAGEHGAASHTAAHASAHASAHAGAAAVPHAPAHDDGAHLCQCLGHGCCPAGVLAPTVQAVRWRVVVARRAEPAPAAEVTAPRAGSARLLPWPNGPPAPTA